MEPEGDGDEEKATEAMIAASDAVDAGNFELAVEKYSEAIRVCQGLVCPYIMVSAGIMSVLPEKEGGE